MKQIYLLYTTDGYETERLVEAGMKNGVEVVKRQYQQIQINNDFGKWVEELRQAEAIISRVSFYETKFVSQFRTMLLKGDQIIRRKMLNGEGYWLYETFSKALQTFLMREKGIPVPETRYSYDYFKKVDLPVVFKGITGSQGKDVYLVEDEGELKKLERQYGGGNYILQEVLPLGVDYRALVIGGEVLGIFKKEATDGFRTNYAAGGRLTKVSGGKSEEIGQLALRAMKAMDCEYGGVDVMYDAKGNPRVLEINRGANFEGFESVFGKVVAEKIVEYMLERES